MSKIMNVVLLVAVIAQSVTILIMLNGDERPRQVSASCMETLKYQAEVIEKQKTLIEKQTAMISENTEYLQSLAEKTKGGRYERLFKLP